tara:strand:- start:2315 stop:2629 length:315 start_codon:yes stop_codon:yes gene_type:complete
MIIFTNATPIIICIVVVTICFPFIIVYIAKEIVRALDATNNRRVAPVGSANWARRIIRARELSRQFYEIEMQNHYEKQQKINEQIKNSVIFINPDHTVQIGFQN